MLTSFPMLTLSELFDHTGRRRNGSTYKAKKTGVLHSELVFQGRLGQRMPQDNQARKLLDKIIGECQLRNTGWRCIVGWAIKSNEPK